MNVAILGYGNIGSGVARLFSKNHKSIRERSMQTELELKYLLDVRDYPGDEYEQLIIHDFDTVLNDESVGIVVETIGGLKYAYPYVLACLKAGKSVVTSNKELVAEKGVELLRVAQEKNVNFLFEASVGGGIPIIRPITQCLAANELDEIAGILNGTTNFILTCMIQDGMSFGDALALAQQNGYAEPDPTADVDGHDACRKICILASLCFGKNVSPALVHTEGIRGITLADVAYAKSWGGVIKLLGRAKRTSKGASQDCVGALVSPALVSSRSQLAGVNDVFNAILVRGDAIGDVLFYGRGAGQLPTASAVMADVIDCAKHLHAKRNFGWAESQDGYVADYLDAETVLYVRALAENPKDVLAAAEQSFGSLQILSREGAPQGEIAFVTPADTERMLRAKLDALSLKQESVIRVTDY